MPHYTVAVSVPFKYLETEKRCIIIAKRACGAPWVIKSGNLSMQEILVVTSALVRTPVRTDSGGRGGDSQGNPTRGRRMPSFLV